MPIFPCKWNPSVVRIRKLSNRTVKDADFGHSIGKKEFEDEISLEGQVNFFKNASYRMMDRFKTGDRETVKGYIIFRQCDLDNLGLEITPGDALVSVHDKNGFSTVVNGRFVHIPPVAPLRGRNILVRAYFTHDYDTRESTRK